LQTEGQTPERRCMMAHFYEKDKYNTLEYGGQTWLDKKDVDYNIQSLRKELETVKAENKKLRSRNA
jgi:hypothetical protein